MNNVYLIRSSNKIVHQQLIEVLTKP